MSCSYEGRTSQFYKSRMSDSYNHDTELCLAGISNTWVCTVGDYPGNTRVDKLGVEKYNHAAVLLTADKQ